MRMNTTIRLESWFDNEQKNNLVMGKEIYWEWESISDILFDDFVFSSTSTQQWNKRPTINIQLCSNSIL